MEAITNYLILIRRYIILSFKDLVEFPFELTMRIIQVFFEIGFIYLFWISLYNVGVVFSGWTTSGIVMLSSMNLFSEAISKISFGFRDLEYSIIGGDFDKYLTRPINPFFSMIMDKLNVFTIVTKLIISLAGMIYICNFQKISLYNIRASIICLLLGTLSFDLLYGAFSMLAFWFGKIYMARELIFSFKSAKKYPLDIYPNKIMWLFTYVIPLGFLSTIPTKILLGDLRNINLYLLVAVASFIINLSIFKFVSNRALSKYNSTGS